MQNFLALAKRSHTPHWSFCHCRYDLGGTWLPVTRSEELTQAALLCLPISVTFFHGQEFVHAAIFSEHLLCTRTRLDTTHPVFICPHKNIKVFFYFVFFRVMRKIRSATFLCNLLKVLSAIKSVVLNQRRLSLLFSQEILAVCLATLLLPRPGWRCVYRVTVAIYRVEAKDAIKTPTMHRTASPPHSPHRKGLSGPKWL